MADKFFTIQAEKSSCGYDFETARGPFASVAELRADLTKNPLEPRGTDELAEYLVCRVDTAGRPTLWDDVPVPETENNHGH